MNCKNVSANKQPAVLLTYRHNTLNIAMWTISKEAKICYLNVVRTWAYIATCHLFSIFPILVKRLRLIQMAEWYKSIPSILLFNRLYQRINSERKLKKLKAWYSTLIKQRSYAVQLQAYNNLLWFVPTTTKSIWKHFDVLKKRRSSGRESFQSQY
jgi:hypothetical protein